MVENRCQPFLDLLPVEPFYDMLLKMCKPASTNIDHSVITEHVLQMYDDMLPVRVTRFSEGTSADREIQRTLMELLNQMDGFDVLGQVSVGHSLPWQVAERFLVEFT